MKRGKRSRVVASKGTKLLVFKSQCGGDGEGKMEMCESWGNEM